MSVWLTNLADVLRAAGCSVIEETYTQGRYKGKSWKQVGFGGQGLSSFDYILWHHDASSVGDSPGALAWMKYYAKDGDYDLTPAAAAWVCSGCNGAHPSGTWHIYAAGLSNHAGRGGPWSPNNGSPAVSRDGMNARAWGVEVDHTLGESWTGEKKQAQLAGLRLGTAAVLRAYKLPPERVIRHLDWTNGQIDGVPRLATFGRKNDIDGLDLAKERATLAALIAKLDGASPADRLAKAQAAAAETEAEITKLQARLARLRRIIRRLTPKAGA